MAEKRKSQTKQVPDNPPDYFVDRGQRLKDEEESGRNYGRALGRERQEEANTLGGVLGTPAAYIKRAGQYLGDQVTNADAYLSEKLGMQQRAASRRGELAGLRDEGYKKGGSVSSASSRADGIAQRGKTKGTIVMCGGGMYKK